jgi:nitroreductase
VTDPGSVPFDLATVDRLLTTTKAVRKRLDLDRPVARELVLECLRLAAYAPNASNRQEWRWLVIDDPAVKAAVGEEYRRVLVPAVQAMRAEKLAAGDAPGVRISDSILYLAEVMGRAPVLVVPCFHFAPRPDEHLAQIARMYGSTYPAIWSFQLALRSRGLGSALTTAHLLDEPAMARVLGIPDGWSQIALLPVGHVTGGDFSPSPRRPIEEFVSWNGWADA